MKKTTNNKGFSLIELIIVIAIMAVLVAVIAPNLTKYLGSSKESTDNKNLDEIEATVNTCITDYEMSNSTLLADGASLTLTWSSTGVTSSTSNTTLEGIINTAIDASKTESKVTAGTYAQCTVEKDSTTHAYKINAVFP